MDKTERTATFFREAFPKDVYHYHEDGEKGKMAKGFLICLKRASESGQIYKLEIVLFLKSEVVHILLKESSEGENRPKAVERLARRAEVVLPLILFDQFMIRCWL